jgi:DNA-directed RNA polymerase subunit RPC12/RpoP
MSRFKCPKCAKPFHVNDAKEERVSVCPNCGQKVRLGGTEAQAASSLPAQPAAAPAQPAPLPETPSVFELAMEKPGSPNLDVLRMTEGPPVVTPVGPILDDDSDDDDEPPSSRRSRRRRKKKPRETGRMDRLIPGVDNSLIGAGIVGFVWTILLVLTVWKSSWWVALIVYGMLLVISGVIWMYSRALEDGLEFVPRPDFIYGYGIIGSIILSVYTLVNLLIFTFVSVYYLITNPGRAWQPLALIVLGWIVAGSGMWLRYGQIGQGS